MSDCNHDWDGHGCCHRCLKHAEELVEELEQDLSFQHDLRLRALAEKERLQRKVTWYAHQLHEARCQLAQPTPRTPDKGDD